MSRDHNISLSQFEDIERYLLQEMEPEEATAFAEQLSSNAVLKAQTDELRLTFLAIQEDQLQSRLNQFHQHQVKTVSEKKMYTIAGKGTIWLAAASIILVAGITTWLFLKPPSGDALYAAYFKPDDGLISAMGISEQYAFERAMIDYKTGNFKAAIQVWDSLNRAQRTNDTLAYFLGAAYLGDNQPGKAIPFFKQVSAGQSIFEKDANWYLGLVLLKDENTKEAVKYIERSDHAGKQSLLDKIKKKAK